MQLNVQALIQSIRDASCLGVQDIPRVLGELERLRAAELWSALCAAAATPRPTMPSGEIGFLTVAEIANPLKFSRGHVYELVRNGRLPGNRSVRQFRSNRGFAEARGVGSRASMIA
jgi:excisionase family DNA binding protein